MGENNIIHGLASQLLAGLYMLKDCIDRCPEKEWNERHNDYPFSQVVFHTLFDCDYSLCDNREEFKSQIFHKNNREIFADYEELEDRIRNHLYNQEFIQQYYKHCVKKVINAINIKSNDDLLIPNNDVYKNMTQLERYVNAIRHIQHHTAQLGLRLQFVTDKEMDWISRGYRE
jgi:hypothetical protein